MKRSDSILQQFYMSNLPEYQTRGSVLPGYATPLPRSTDVPGNPKPVMQMTMADSLAKKAIANQPSIRPAYKSTDREEIIEKNRQYAASTGKRFNPNSGAVTPLFSDNTDQILRRAQENIVNPMLEIEMMRAAPGIMKKGIKLFTSNARVVGPGRTIEIIGEAPYNPEFYYIDEMGVRRAKPINAGPTNAIYNKPLTPEEMPKLYSQLTREEWKNHYRDQRIRRNNNDVEYLRKNFFKQGGGPIVDPRGQWAHPGKVTRIPGSSITMQGVPYPLYAKPNKGKGKVIYPGENHDFPKADYVDEYPMIRKGGIPKMQSLGTVPQGTQNAMNEGAAWLRNWYQQRMQQPQFKEIARKRYDLLSQTPGVIVDDKDLARDRAEAAYDPVKDKFIIPSIDTRGSTDPTIWAHEFNHRTKFKAPQDFERSWVKGYSKNFLNSREAEKNHGMPRSSFMYIRNPYETEAFLTAFRKEANLDPNKSYSKEEMLEKMKPYMESPSYKDIRKQSYDEQKQHSIKRFLQLMDNDPEKVLYLHNGIVGNDRAPMIPMAKAGGQTRDEREMVNGIADILAQVRDRKNRAEIARNMVGDFNREDVQYDYEKFMRMSKLQQGGQFPMMQNGGEKLKDVAIGPEEDIDPETEFMEAWMNSPKYAEMLKKSTSSDNEYNTINQKRWQNIRRPYVKSELRNDDVINEGNIASTNILWSPRQYANPFIPGSANVPSQKIGFDVRYNPKMFAGLTPLERMLILIHERSHSTDMDFDDDPYNSQTVVMPLKDKERIGSNEDLTGYSRYVKRPTEVRARLNELRFLGKETGVYNPFTENINLDKLKQLNKSYSSSEIRKDSPYDDLLEVYTPEQIVELLNSVSIASNKGIPMAKNGGQHGGLDRWFAEKWVDVKSGKPCGRQEGESRAYPACRPSRRVSSETPKTSSEMSPAEKAKFKRSKTSSERINYNHKRN